MGTMRPICTIMRLIHALFRLLVKALFYSVLAFSFVGAANADLLTGAGLGLGLGVAAFAIAVTGGFAVPISAAVGTSLFIGGSIAGITFDNPTQANSSGQTAALYVQLNPKTALPIVPAGWSAPAAGATQPVPPSSGTVYRQYNPLSHGMQTMSTQSACNIQSGQFSPGAVSSISPGTETSGNLTCNYVLTNGATGFVNVGAQSIAETGYTLAGTYPSQTASLTTASSVQKNKIDQATGLATGDGHRAFVRSGNTFTADPQDIADSLPQNVVGSGTGTVCVYGNDGSVGCASAASDGTSTLTQVTPDSGGTTSTRTTVTTSAPNATTGEVDVTGYKKETVQGVGAPAAGAAAAGAQPIGSGSGGTGGTTDVSNLATHADVNALGPKLDQIHTDLTPNNDTSLSTQKSDIDTQAGVMKDQVTNIGTEGLNAHGLSWTWLPDYAGSSCQPFTMTYAGSARTVDICPTVAKINTILSYVFYILTAWTLFNTLTGRRE